MVWYFQDLVCEMFKSFKFSERFKNAEIYPFATGFPVDWTMNNTKATINNSFIVIVEW